MIVISGHPRWDTTVNVTGLKLRCRGVQEFDIVPSVKGMTKYAIYLNDPLSARAEVRKALKIAMEGRRGPVWISVPLDIQSTVVDEDDLYEYDMQDGNKYKLSEEDIWFISD